MSSDQPINLGPAERRVRDQLIADLNRATGKPQPAAEPTAEPPAKGPREKPIAFNAAMARALLAGHKTLTRRPIRPLPAGAVTVGDRRWPADAAGKALRCGLAAKGEVLWVREPWNYASNGRGYIYEADIGPAAAQGRKWRPGRFMARSASRMNLHVLSVWPERLTQTSPTDAMAEGMPPGLFTDTPASDEAAVAWFSRLWDTVYGGTELAWKENPWVWVVRFRVIEPERK